MAVRKIRITVNHVHGIMPLHGKLAIFLAKI
jgi:hypothetical protein